MSIQSRADKPRTSFRHWLEEPVPLSCAIIGGTIGAFTSNLLGTIGGMVLGVVVASAIDRYADASSRAHTNDKTPVR
jgi:hypothetical protein